MIKRFEYNSIILLSISMATNVINYCFQAISGRLLSVDAFGTLNALLSLFLIVSSPSSAIRMTVAKYVAECNIKRKNNKNLLSHIMKCLLTITLISSILSIIFVMLRKYYLRDDNIWLIVLTIFAAIATYFQFATIGYAQGKQNFIAMPLISMILAVIKVLGIFLAIFLFSKFIEPIMSIIIFLNIGVLLSTVIGVKLISHDVNISSNIKILPHDEKVISVVFLVQAVVINLYISFMLNIDVLLINSFFSKYIAGLYSSAMMWGRILIYALTAVINVMYSSVVEGRANKENTLRLYNKALIYCVLGSILFFLAINFFGNQFTILIFGKKYAESIIFIKYSFYFGFVVALNILNINYLLAVNKAKLLITSLSVGFAVCVVLGLLMSYNITHLLISISIILFMIFLINFAYIFYESKNFEAKER